MGSLVARVAVVVVGAGLLACAGDRRSEGLREAPLVEVDGGGGPSAPAAEPRPAEGPVQLLVVAPEGTAEPLRAAVEAASGRVLAVFDEPALVVRVPASGLGALEAALPAGAVAAPGPVLEPALVAAAPGATGFWNRRHGVRGPAASGVPGRRAAPDRRPAPPPPLGPPVELAPEREARCREVLRGFLRCLAGTDAVPCLDRFVDPAERAAMAPLLEREAAVAESHAVDPDAYGFALEGFDGRQARFRVLRDGHPTGTLRVALDGEAVRVVGVDP